MNIALTTSVYTLAGGTLLLLFSEFVRGYVVKPSIKVRAHLGTIVDRIIYYQRFLLSSGANTPPDMADNLRSAATQLRANVHVVVWYRLMVILCLTPSHEKVEVIARGLTGLANSEPLRPTGIRDPDYTHHNRECIKQIGDAIGFDFEI